ncbi:hypothetical protein B7494_g1930 [Chlorociboria aeruginascens]|nr:hypothetical protein B7494_g1930 [Chlorociboria aeruginascens]
MTDILVNATLSVITDHPYYPLQLEIKEFVENECSMPTLLGIFFSLCAVLAFVTRLMVKRARPNLARTEKAAIVWLVLSGAIHFFFEGFFSLNHYHMGASQHVLGQMWKEYALGDSRYLISDPFVLCMETVTAFTWGPLCFIVAIFIATTHPLRHPLQIIVCVGQLYGLILYYATSMFDHYYKNLTYSRPEFLYFWVYYFFMNFIWMVIPGILLVHSVRTIAKAFTALEQINAAKSNDVLKPDVFVAPGIQFVRGVIMQQSIDFSKRTGLERAVHRIEEALKTSKNKDSEPDEAFHLQRLLSEAKMLNDQHPGVDIKLSDALQAPFIQTGNCNPTLPNPNVHPQSSPDDDFALDDAENPLQLLARAADHPPPQQPLTHHNLQVPRIIHLDKPRDESLRKFFGPFQPRLDIGDDIDPIDLGFVTVEEADVLFAYFYQNLSHTRWGLDPVIHTANFVRSRSAFLFTSILAASTLFISTAGALSKRLSNHCKHLGHHVMVAGYRSPEIVLGFMVNVPWMTPGAGAHWADDETCLFVTIAFAIAVDLSLNKLITPSPSRSTSKVATQKSDCISARRALDMDGFDDIDPSSAWGKRLLRRRERIWLALFVLDRGVCLARGRTFTVPISPLIETCDQWHVSEMADTWDSSIISSAVLRRDLVTLIADIKRSCDDQADGPPVVRDSVINHPTASPTISRFFRAAGLSSALNVMRASVQGESQLKSMPNNTAIMISFSACFALYLSTMAVGNYSSLTSSIRTLIEETANVLERIGESPAHRRGASGLYGRHLKEILNGSTRLTNLRGEVGVSASTASRSENGANMNQGGFLDIQDSQQRKNGNEAMFSPEPLQFSAMSDFQIVEAIHNAGDELETFSTPDFQIDDASGLDWLEWFD